LVLFRSDPDFAELLWENGQIVTHDHSARPTCTTKFPQITAATGTTVSVGNGFSNGKTKNDILIAGARADADDESMVPWIQSSLHGHQPVPLPSSPLPSDDFCSDFFEAFADANSTSLSFGFGFTLPQSAIAAPCPAPAPAPAPARLSKGDTGTTNFSLFKDCLTGRARASTSTKHTPAPAPADKKHTTKSHDQPLLPLTVTSSSVCSVNVNEEEGHSTKPPESNHARKRKIREATNTEALPYSLLIYTSPCSSRNNV
jgi:hypothetical protein